MCSAGRDRDRDAAACETPPRQQVGLVPLEGMNARAVPSLSGVVFGKTAGIDVVESTDFRIYEPRKKMHLEPEAERHGFHHAPAKRGHGIHIDLHRSACGLNVDDGQESRRGHMGDHEALRAVAQITWLSFDTRSGPR